MESLVSLLGPYCRFFPSTRTRIYSTMWWDESGNRFSWEFTIWFVRFIFSWISSPFVCSKLSFVLSQEEGTWRSMADPCWFVQLGCEYTSTLLFLSTALKQEEWGISPLSTLSLTLFCSIKRKTKAKKWPSVKWLSEKFCSVDRVSERSKRWTNT